MTIIGLIAGALLIASIGYNRIQYKRQQNSEEYIEELEDWVFTFSNRLKGAIDRMEAIDKSGAFANDDSVGWTFTELKDIVQELDELAQFDENEENGKEEEEQKVLYKNNGSSDNSVQ